MTSSRERMIAEIHGVQIFQNAVDAVLNERQRQRTRWTLEHDGRHDALQWAGLVTRYIGRAVDAAEASDTSGYEEALIKAGAVCIAALESLGIVLAALDTDLPIADTN